MGIWPQFLYLYKVRRVVFGLASTEGTQGNVRHCGIVPCQTAFSYSPLPELLNVKETVDNEKVLN